MKFVKSLLIALIALATALAGGVLTAAEASAAPWKPAIKVFLADGVTPVGDTQLHPGDQVVVKGTGFDPNSNTSGLPVPVPPGVPHGTFISFGPFASKWRPSADAPESARPTNRSTTKWAISNEALSRVPSAPFDFQRTIRQQSVPLSANGSFTARITLAQPKTFPANGRWGIYTYGAADAVNASQELFVPINFSTADGPNTPKPAVKNLVWAYSPSFYSTFAKTTQGSVVGRDGAAVDESGNLSFELVENTVKNGNGVLRYKGTVIAKTRFSLAEIALADPIIRFTNGKAVLSLRTSSTNQNGDDALRRIDIADVSVSAAQAAKLARGENVSGLPAAFRAGITPELLALVSMGQASPVNVRF